MEPDSHHDDTASLRPLIALPDAHAPLQQGSSGEAASDHGRDVAGVVVPDAGAVPQAALEGEVAPCACGWDGLGEAGDAAGGEAQAMDLRAEIKDYTTNGTINANVSSLLERATLEARPRRMRTVQVRSCSAACLPLPPPPPSPPAHRHPLARVCA